MAQDPLCGTQTVDCSWTTLDLLYRCVYALKSTTGKWLKKNMGALSATLMSTPTLYSLVSVANKEIYTPIHTVHSLISMSTVRYALQHIPQYPGCQRDVHSNMHSLLSSIHANSNICSPVNSDHFTVSMSQV